jgi:hypothetical protein
LRNHGDRVSELESSGARLKASCKTADAASQTDPVPTEEYDAPTAAADVKKDAVCDALGNNSETKDVTDRDQTIVLQHAKPKKKRRPRKNRSRGARSRAKAAAALALSEVETATSPPPTKDSAFPVTEAIATSALEKAEVAALVLPTNDSPVPVAEAAVLIPPTDNSPAPEAEDAALTKLTEDIPVSVTEVIHKSAVDLGPATPAEDRRCVILPAKDHSFDHRLQPVGVNMKNLFQGFRPPLVDPCRLSRWFQVTKLDLRKQHV